MNGKNRKGDVRFEQAPAKVVAERPNDRGMKADNERMKSEDGFPGSCGGV